MSNVRFTFMCSSKVMKSKYMIHIYYTFSKIVTKVYVYSPQKYPVSIYRDIL